MFGPDDDEDFAPALNSKLASLFGQRVEEGNASLTYTAPKQPKKSRPGNASPASTTSPGKLGIIIVQAVQTYKLEEGNYINQGKLGAALLGNAESKSYQLLLYKNKQQHITSTKITEKFQFTVQAQNYATFYDDKGQNWSLMFESESNAVDFARQAGLARACVPSERGELPFYSQDLKVGEGSGAEMGDFLEIRYTVLPFENGKLGKTIENNMDADRPQRVSIRKGVWEEALLGAAKGCKRLIVLASVLFGPWKQFADANHRIVVEVEIGRIKRHRRSRESTPIDVLQGPNHPDSSESNVDSSTDETSIKARGASISEALTNSPKTHKASIISRMARMGQATLPLKGAVVCNPSDSEETEEECSGNMKSALKPRNLSGKRSAAASLATTVPQVATVGSLSAASVSSSMPAQQVSVYQPAPVSWHPQNSQPYLYNGVPLNLSLADSQLFAASHQQVLPVPAMLPTPTTTPSSDSHLSVYLSESRTHNAELRIGLTKVADKVDQVLGKLDTLQQPRIVGALEPRTLLASIQKLVLENEQLQAELADKRLKMEQQNEKMYQLLHQKFLEQSSASSVGQQQDTALQAVILELQQEKAKLTIALNDAVTKTNTFQIQASSCEQISNELRGEVENLTGRLQTAHSELDKHRQTFLDQEALIQHLREKTDTSHDSQDSLIEDLQLKVNDMKVAKSLVDNALSQTRQEMEDMKNRMTEQALLRENAHKEKIAKLEKHCIEQIKEAVKNNTSCEENCTHLSDLKKLETENRELNCHISDVKDQLKTASISSVEDVKKVMNVMFRLLKAEFVPGTSYDGSAVRKTMLCSIQDITLQYVQMKTEAIHKMDSDQRVALDQANSISRPSEQSTHNQETTNNSIKISENAGKSIENKVQSNNSSKHDESLHENATDTNAGGEQINAKDGITIENPPKVVEPDSEPNVFIEESKTKSEEGTKEKVDSDNGKEPTLGSTLQVEKPRESSVERGWRPQPPPSPLFDDEEDDDDDWLS